MEEISTAYVYLSISGKKLDFDEFSKKAEVLPTKSGEDRFGEKFIEYRIEAKDSNEGLDQSLELLANNLAPKSKRISKYIYQKNLYAKVFIVLGHKYDEDIGVFFSSRFIKFLFEIGAEVEIDAYKVDQ